MHTAALFSFFLCLVHLNNAFTTSAGVICTVTLPSRGNGVSYQNASLFLSDNEQRGQLFSVTYVGGIGLMADLGESVKLDGIGAGDFTPSAPLNWVTATPLAKGHTFLLLSNKPSMMNVLMAFRIADITPDNTVTLEFGIVNYMTHSRQGGDNSVIEVGSAWTVLSQGKCVKQTLSASCDSQ